MAHPFLSEAWMAEARALREKYAGHSPAVTTSVRINQIVTDVPFGDGEVRSHMDTSSGSLVLELGELDEPDAVVTTDYETAKAIFVEQDQAFVMSAFMNGRIKIQGDMTKLMAMMAALQAEAAHTDEEVAARLAAELEQMTE